MARASERAQELCDLQSYRGRRTRWIEKGAQAIERSCTPVNFIGDERTEDHEHTAIDGELATLPGGDGFQGDIEQLGELGSAHADGLSHEAKCLTIPCAYLYERAGDLEFETLEVRSGKGDIATGRAA